MNIVLETVTPKLAEAWINANKSNRKLREGLVEKYTCDMRAGKWTQCPEPISFYADGDLADGQHRLFAIIESDTTQEFPIARGLSREAGLNINTGAGRTLIDNARISGADTSLSPTLIAAAKAIEFGSLQWTGKGISNAETLSVVERHRAAAHFAATHVKRKQLLCGATVLGAVGRAWYVEPDKNRIVRFCEVLGSGFYEGDAETAAVTLRNYLLAKGSTASSSGLWHDTFLKAQNALSYFMRGKKLTTIKSVAEEIYPLTKRPKRK